MRIIDFITFSADIAKILAHIGVNTEPPRMTPARGPPLLWDDCDARDAGDAVDAVPAWDMAVQPAPDDSLNQRTAWRKSRWGAMALLG